MLLNKGEGQIIFSGIRPLQKLGATARGLAWSNPLVNMAFNQRVPDRLESIPPDPWSGDSQNGRDLISGIFRFAGQTLERESLSWQPEYARAEWIAGLHGFEWLRDLRSVGGDRARRMAREMVGNWLNAHQKPDPVAWRADIMGIRLSAWISFHDFFCATAEDDFRKKYFSSLVRQARHLSRILPEGLTGVPLMKALKGLAWTGIALEGGEDRLEQAFQMILTQIHEQVLPDGAHISRSPQATFEFLQCLVDLRSALMNARLELPADVQHAIDKITPAVKFFRHADGGLAQFNGGQEGNAHICETTLMYSGARGRAMRSLPHCGYEGLQQGRSSLIMDTGVPLHGSYSDRAHAGALSFEYSYGRDRIFVNCGSSDVAGRWRNLLRSTAAHSTIVVDYANSCSLEDKGFVLSRPDVRVKRQEEKGVVVLAGSHNGYVPRYGLTHRRIVCLRERGEILAGEDQLTGKSGIEYSVRFHLHPSIQASLIKDGTEILLRARSGTGWRFTAQGAVMAIEDSVYGSEGEHPRRTLQIALNAVTEGSMNSVTWELQREKL